MERRWGERRRENEEAWGRREDRHEEKAIFKMSDSIGDVQRCKGSLTWFRLFLQGSLSRKSVWPSVSSLRRSHLCRMGSLSTEQFKKVKLFFLSAGWWESMSPSKVLRCSAFILSSFHTPANALFLHLPPSLTKGKEEVGMGVGGLREKAKCSFLCATPSHFFSALPQMILQKSEKPPSQLLTKETSFVCVCVCETFVCSPMDSQKEDVFRSPFPGTSPPTPPHHYH